MRFYFSSINLGCNKNLVDLEFLIGEVLKHSQGNDIRYFEDPADQETEYVFINTCGFLSTSREEAENTIKTYDDIGKKLIIVGCYLQVANKDFLDNLKNLYKLIPFVDYKSVMEILGIKPDSSFNKEAIQKIGSAHVLAGKKLEQFLSNVQESQIGKKAFIWKGDEVRAYINAPFGYEYLKIAEGCDNNCTFCIIPKIRGKQKSRPIEEVLEEAKIMINNGIREIILIAQDTTRYGTDIYDEPRLIELLEGLEKLEGDFKYRLLYMYPDNLTLSHIDKLKTFKRFIPYFDIPFQHISINILKRMGRYYDTKNIFKFLDHIKASFDEYYLRTAFIVGFPGETDQDQKELENFISKYEFDSVALFEYHDEPLAPSSKLDEKISSEAAVRRIKKLDKILQDIYTKKKLKDKKKRFFGTLEGYDDDKAYIRRDIRAPEIDELDEVKFKNLLSNGDVEIGDRVEYLL